MYFYIDSFFQSFFQKQLFSVNIHHFLWRKLFILHGLSLFW